MRTTSYRESDETTRQLEALTERLGENRGRVIARAVDRMYREEENMNDAQLIALTERRANEARHPVSVRTHAARNDDERGEDCRAIAWEAIAEFARAVMERREREAAAALERARQCWALEDAPGWGYDSVAEL